MTNIYYGTAVETATTTPSTTAPVGQVFCSVEELLDNSPDDNGGDPAMLLDNIKAASRVIVQEIGRFIPTYEVRRLHGYGKSRLWVPPLLSVTSIVNYTDTLTTADYLLMPNGRMWPDGPYTNIEVDPDATLLTVWYDEEDRVAITGLFGLYLKSVDLGANSNSLQGASATTLVVDDGSKVSPGMVLLIGSEQELVTGVSTPSLAVTTLAEALDVSEEEVDVASGALINVGEIIRRGFEQMKVLDINSNTLYVRRGWNNTKKSAHSTSASVDVYRTFTVERGVNGTTAAAHGSGTDLLRYQVPDDVRILTVEIATLMRKKALGGFAGKTGSAELGEVYYHDLFPRFDLARVKQHYQIPGVAG